MSESFDINGFVSSVAYERSIMASSSKQQGDWMLRSLQGFNPPPPPPPPPPVVYDDPGAGGMLTEIVNRKSFSHQIHSFCSLNETAANEVSSNWNHI